MPYKIKTISWLAESIEGKLRKAKEELEKARQKMSDEYDSNDEAYSDEDSDYDEGFREFDPDDEESAGEDWLKENDPDQQGDQDGDVYGDGSEYDEYGDGEDEEAHQRGIDEDYGNVGSTRQDVEPRAAQVDQESVAPQAKIQAQDSPQEVSGKKGRFRQPSREDIIAMRNYTRPWEQRARETSRLQADPSKNPVLAHQGNIIEARNLSHADRRSAYQQMINSDEYKNADPISQMEMDDKFETDWSTKNPEHLKTALQAHHGAHEKSRGGKDAFAANKDAKIRNILTGGGHGSDETFSTEEGLQHAGGTRGEEGTVGSIVQDPAASFAGNNQDFIRQYAQDYEKKGKRPANIDEMMDYNDSSKKDISRILGPNQSKDPKFEEFFSHYYPLIGMSAHKTLNRLGLDHKSPDIDMSMLHEAGMHGLIQAINDYQHDNPSKASFATHAGNKIRGLQMTAMRNVDQIPAELRQAQKKFQTQKNQPQAATPGSATTTAAPAPETPKLQQPQAPSKVDIAGMISSSKHPMAAEMGDRLKRIGTQRAAQQVKIRKAPTGGSTGGTPGGTP